MDWWRIDTGIEFKVMYECEHEGTFEIEYAANPFIQGEPFSDERITDLVKAVAEERLLERCAWCSRVGPFQQQDLTIQAYRGSKTYWKRMEYTSYVFINNDGMSQPECYFTGYQDIGNALDNYRHLYEKGKSSGMPRIIMVGKEHANSKIIWSRPLYNDEALDVINIMKLAIKNGGIKVAPGSKLRI